MQDTFARARTLPMQPLGQARATIGYLVYNSELRMQWFQTYILLCVAVVSELSVFLAF